MDDLASKKDVIQLFKDLGNEDKPCAFYLQTDEEGVPCIVEYWTKVSELISIEELKTLYHLNLIIVESETFNVWITLMSNVIDIENGTKDIDEFYSGTPYSPTSGHRLELLEYCKTRLQCSSKRHDREELHEKI